MSAKARDRLKMMPALGEVPGVDQAIGVRTERQGLERFAQSRGVSTVLKEASAIAEGDPVEAV
ncbi:MAG: hypothetical protein JW955_24840, partial [Sedimentisphaerales bacterium]|nr:hypothetical protein [Sedimentisphaerales bacterium]